MSPNPNVRIYAKLEMLNPTGSVKDRVAKYLIDDLETRGLLHEDSIILEPTSGQHRHRPGDDRPAEGLPRRARHARQRHQRAAPDGGAVRRGGHRLPGRRRAATARSRWPSTSSAKDERFVMPYQYGNPANPLAHFETTGPEILADCPEIDVFVAGLGTSGTLMGVVALPARAQARRPDRRRRAAARRAGPGPALARRRVHPGDPRPVAASTRSTSSRTATRSRRCASSCSARGSSPGRRAGPCWSPRRAWRRRWSRGTIVALLPDGGWKYLSAGTFSTNLDEMEEALEGGVNWW